MSKNACKRVAAVLLFCLVVCAFTACTTTLKGKYINTEGLVQQSFTFKDDNKVEVSAFGINIEGEYTIEDDQITIRYTLGSLSYDETKSFKKEGNSIFIDGVEFVKEK